MSGPAEAVPAPVPAAVWSLRRRLLLLTSAACVLAVCCGCLAAFLTERHISDSLFDQRLHDMANSLLTFADHEINEIQAEGGDIVHLEGARSIGVRYRYQIWSDTGELLLVSINAPRTPFVPWETPGFTTAEVNGQPMRVVVMVSDDGLKHIEVAEPMSAREAGTDQILVLLVAPLALALALLVGGTSWFVQRATRSLKDSAFQVTKRTPDDLKALQVDNAPAELSPIIDALNSLFRRIESALASERRFTSAAAHELRTPLAAVKIQAQVALLTQDDADRRVALERLLASVNSAAHMIDQLLTLTRVDGLIALRAQTVPIELDTLCGHVIDEMRPIAARRAQVIDAELDPADVDGLEFGIAVLIRNLIDNAMRYGPEGGRIRVRTGRNDDQCFVSIEDQGPGIPPDQYQNAFKRFVRLPGGGTVDGCGIGLSIVQAVVDVHRARIELGRSEMGGLKVTIHFLWSPSDPRESDYDLMITEPLVAGQSAV